MQILNRGNKADPRQPMRFHCLCGCVFVAMNTEYYVGVIPNTYICECPQCHEDVTFSEPISTAKWFKHTRPITDSDGCSRRGESGYMCDSCGYFMTYPTELCPNCRSLMERDK